MEVDPGGAAGILAAARELGVPSQSLESALEKDRAAFVLDAPSSAQALAKEESRLVGAVRDRVVQTIEGFRALLTSLGEFGIDPAEALTRLETVFTPVPTLPAAELPRALAEARRVVEEPVVGLVAGLLEEVRPKLVEARRLGRNSTEVFAAMNRAREALRLRIYGEAIAASQEAVERVSALTEDLEAARDELQTVTGLLDHLSSTGFPHEEYRPALAEVREHLERVELPAVEERLRVIIQQVGAAAVLHFRTQISDLERLGQLATQLGFLPSEFGDHLLAAGKHLEEGEIPEAATACARLQVELRTAAQPYLANRLDEISKGLAEIPDGALVDPVRRLLADADVGLRVKEDLKGAFDTLRRAEREFSVVSAQHASSLVDGLEEELRVLTEMGGSGEEIQRQIDEVQQIFNMGDFVKAFRAAQDIRSRAHTQQLLRSEEAISHAKLALVELSKMGLDPSALKASLEAAQGSAREGLYPESYRSAQKTLDSAAKLKTTAQAILDRIRAATEQWESLKDSGAPVQPYAEQIALARTACEGLEFERAARLVDELRAALGREQARFEGARCLDDCDLMVEDLGRLGLPVEGLPGRIGGIRDTLGSPAPEEAWGRARALETELVSKLRPVLEENLRSLERDVEIARTVPLDVEHAAESLGEIRRKLAAPIPVGVAELLDAGRAKFFETKGFLEHAERATKRAREELNRAEIVRVDVRPFRPRLERVERHLSERDYARVIEQASHLEREIAQAIRQQVAKTLATFQGTLAAARKESALTALAENLLEQARTALEAGEPMEALTLAARSEGELERAELQLKIASSSLERLDHRLRAAQRTGLNAPASVQALEEARAAFGAREFPRVLERCLAASDALAAATELERRGRDSLESAERAIREAGEMNAELTDVLPLLERARVFLKAGEYDRSMRQSLEAGDAARWAIERLYAGPLAELQELGELVRSAGSEEDAVAVRSARQDAEAAVKIRDWKRASETLARGRERSYLALDRPVQSAERSLHVVYSLVAAPPEPETTHRAAFAERIRAERAERNFTVALDLLREEEAHARERVKTELARKIAELKERLLIGEKISLDTTPVMELFSEAKLALESGTLEGVAKLVEKGEATLETLVTRRLDEKLREVETELIFAREGLHVTLGPAAEKFEFARKRLAEGAAVEAGRALLEVEEELNRRKALHRELTNLHFLVDAALGRAVERRIDTAEARKCLSESVRLRATDYGPALEKAREALRLLHEAIQKVDGGDGPDGVPPARADTRA